MRYWQECISQAFDDAGISASPEQMESVVMAVEGGHENYGMAHGHDSIPDPIRQENEELKKRLKKEQDKTVCRECNGYGSITSLGPVHSSTGQCWKCRGEGKL